MKFIEVFGRFLWLGSIGFGGPAAHLGYFHTTFVKQLHWIDETQFSRLVSLSQFLPGPGSSQVGFAIGLHYAGFLGGLAAFIGFTLPSFALLLWAATAHEMTQSIWMQAAVDGLKLLALVVVADAVFSMTSQFCKTRPTQLLAVTTAAVVLIWPSWSTQVLLLLAAAVIGWHFFSQKNTLSNPPEPSPKSDLRSMSVQTPLSIQMKYRIALTTTFGLVSVLVFVWLFYQEVTLTQTALDFFATGSLVFGGGHVVLPFLQSFLEGKVSEDVFLTGYGLAQIVPGPMFTLATFLGAHLHEAHPWQGALVATFAIFFPGLLLMGVLYKTWHRQMTQPRWQGVSMALNAAVVGLLLAALYQPVFVSAVTNVESLAVAILSGWLFRNTKLPVMALAVLLVLFSVLQHLPGLVDV